MRVLRPGALLGAFLIASPTLWAAVVNGGTSLDAAILRFLIAIVPCGVALALLDGLLDAYVSGVGRSTAPAGPDASKARRRTDVDAGVGS